MPDVFISYSRRDKAFAQQVVTALTDQHYDVWVDFEDIPFATDWWEEICAGIESADAVIFIISPDSLESDYCRLEVNHAVKNKKRLIPILYRQAEPSTVPAHIAALHWIEFTEVEQFDRSLAQLQRTLATDQEAARRHTWLLVRAREWENNGHSPDLLLQGEQLDDVTKLLDSPTLTDLQREYVHVSQERSLRWQMARRFQAGFIGGLLGIAFWAFSTFRSDFYFITPTRVIYTIALGQTFGLCLGLMSALVGELPQGMRRWLPRGAPRRAVQGGLCLVSGVLAWASYLWFLDNLSLTAQDFNTVLVGGLGLAGGFIARLVFTLPGWLAWALTALCIYLPILFTYDRYFAGAGDFISLVLFDRRDQLFSVAIPMVALMALGANAQALYRQAAAFYRQFRTRARLSGST